MTDTQWGAGEKFERFDEVVVGDTDGLPGELWEVGFGEHPHSRSDNTVYARRGPDDEPVGFDGHRRKIEVHVSSGNYLKESPLSGNEIRKWVEGTMTIGGRVARTFGGREVREVLMNIISHWYEVLEGGPSVWSDGRALIGRKIYYRGEPAVVTHVIEDQSCVIVEPAPGGTFFPPPYVVEEGLERVREWMSEHASSAKVNDSDPNIWWWRERVTIEEMEEGEVLEP